MVPHREAYSRARISGFDMPGEARLDSVGAHMDIGIFDHLDRRDMPLDEFYEMRLRLLQRYDAAGFYSYHLAEHHATPLGLAPVPGIFLAAATQRTERIRLGPCVYCLPLYDPLRLIEEVCMLDQLSRGRFDFGVGRGIVPYEMAYFNLHHLETEEIYKEALEVILQGLQSEVLEHRGPRFTYRKVPMILRPFQKPHPPIWYGLSHLGAAEWAAGNKVHVIANGPPEATQPLFQRYREVWQRAHAQARYRPARSGGGHGRAGGGAGSTRLCRVVRAPDEALARLRLSPHPLCPRLRRGARSRDRGGGHRGARTRGAGAAGGGERLHVSRVPAHVRRHERGGGDGIDRSLRRRRHAVSRQALPALVPRA